MLIKRQKAILEELYENQNQFLVAKDLAKKYKVSLRTVKNDFSEIKLNLNNKGAHLLSISSKGHQLVIDDQAVFMTFFEEYRDNNRAGNSGYEQSSRINHIMRKLLNSSSINPARIIDELFISRSTFSNDLKVIRNIFSKYNLQIISNRQGLSISGSEDDIRRCIIRENLLRFAAEDRNIAIGTKASNDAFSKIKNILLEAFINNKIVVSDYVFQNLVVHIYTSLWRMKNNHYITENAEQFMDAAYHHIQLIAQEVMKNICRLYNVQYSQQESNLLAINIQGKRELFENDYISKEIDDFIFQTLNVIKNQYQIDFIDDIDLRISLALHTNPLLTRMNSNLLLNNSITYEIKQNYILVFDIATTFAYELYRKYKIKINDDEISYIALHFANAMQNKNRTSRLQILLISPEKKSNTFLVRQKFNQWFKDDIQSFDIVNLTQLQQIKLSDYDAIFTTDRTISENYGIIYIDLFLNESNYQRIEFALNGFRNEHDVINKFYKELFFHSKLNDKNEIIEFLCQKATSYFRLDNTLHDSIREHENINTSYFGHSIAILHPLTPVTDTTFIATMILDKPILWDEDPVQLILLVSIEKNNPKALSLWYYLSFLISNQKIIDNIIETPTFLHFNETLLTLYKHLAGQ